MDRCRALIVALSLAVVAGLSPHITYAADESVGMIIESRVYLDERPTMIVLNRSTVPAVFTIEPGGGWQVEPEVVELAPDEQTEITVSGDGQDGASIDVRAVARDDPAAGMLRGEAMLTALVYLERPFDPATLAVPLFLAAAGMVAAFTVLGLRRMRSSEPLRRRDNHDHGHHLPSHPDRDASRARDQRPLDGAAS